ncbi:MAG TPA: A24 family peptidase [Acidimicrobiales bacterium]|jgi:prepilin signal peptidase PulO-like enzyme (type II secretory pathway)|nr:A24 family peptidase [Acidimicrobiales bacterium]
MADPVLLAACGAGGLVSGVFVEALAVRHRDDADLDRPLRAPWSRCGSCDAPLHGLELVPVAGPFAHRGRCRECGHVVGVAQLAVQVVNAVLWILAGIRFGASAPLVPYLLLFSGLLTLAVVDLRTYRLPDRLTFPMLYGSVVAVVVLSLVRHEPARILYAAAGSLGFFALLALMAFVSPKGMGWGDVKLARLLGLWLGWLSPILVVHSLLVAGLAGVVVGLVVLAVRRGHSAPFPFGPMLALGAVVAILISPALVA